MTLTELQLTIRDALYVSLPGMHWVTAEISEINENYAGHCYLELIEKQPDEKNIRSRARAIIWSSRYRFLKSFFENTAGQPLRNGLKVLVKVKIEYHEIYGLSLIINDIDPAFTVGDMALKRQAIISRLMEEGVFEMNKELEFPLFPQRIAIISSRNAAGYTDFMNHIVKNGYGYVFYTALFDSAMQGQETEYGIINALDRIAAEISLFDLVVIIRGGGSQTDLSWFDNYNIAYHITQFPLPVITGIGHEKDLSVTDMVAHLPLKTPTAVADYIIDCVAQVDVRLNEMTTEIKNLSHTILEKNRNRIESAGLRLLPLTRIRLSGTRETLSGMIMDLTNNGKKYIYKAAMEQSSLGSKLRMAAKTYLAGKLSASERLSGDLRSLTNSSLKDKNNSIKTLENSLRILSPEKVLARGYTITSVNGKILRSGEELKENEMIDTLFSDGSIKSRVTQGLQKKK